ncbi:hypothetical protein L6452_03519 [Arctium lappa]|uniref:Uncharacterized protein n=1 Tax=Arctium lappa TaxID=4217 RepID=A0ACB9FND9_ARCLA|nr:hypothetical protein L6452_03519 [Arctium lappa]
MNISSNFLQNIIKPFKSTSRKEEQEEDLEKIAAEEHKDFTFQTLISATRNFHPDNKLGHGDFGPVFKGKLEDGRVIVVKKLSHSYQIVKDFTKELRLLTRVQHHQTRVNTRVADTNGYMSPEYAMHGNLTVKTDVYGFGVLVLEIVSGQKNSSFSRDSDSQNLLDWAYKMYKKGEGFEIMDSRLGSSIVRDQVEACVRIGLLCTQSDPKLRPTMDRVVMMLS